MADEEKPVSPDKPRSNVYTILILVTTLAYIAAISLVIMEMQDTANFKHQLFGSQVYPAASSTKK